MFSQQAYLHIQLVFREKIDRRRSFLDEVTQTRCNYQVTSNDLAWNEYIKRGGRYIEFGEFKSTKKLSQKQWPPSLRSSAATAPSTSTPMPPSPVSTARTTAATTTTLLDRQQPLVPARATTVRAQAEERRRRDDEIAREALSLAETNVDQAMDFIRNAMANKFMHHSKCPNEPRYGEQDEFEDMAKRSQTQRRHR
ncbi:unnamed protein product [Didymodactylos carnosus]|uniref:Uncharacterized protein n=1 Tax=Didymodactylos carnosus TaxID=1234261 RepID=A0A8S2H4F2_9BILA|nr:unnamed protein product [Didymodactylos carnosus]CAF3598609.1 unnamed protein product [Didymodactylos carnosus]